MAKTYLENCVTVRKNGSQFEKLITLIEIWVKLRK